MKTQFILGLLFNIAVAVWANARGYSWWAFCICSPLLGAIALLILPNLSDPTMVTGDLEEKKRQGNTSGLVLTGGTLAVEIIKGAML
jgi:hypothetical protein